VKLQFHNTLKDYNIWRRIKQKLFFGNYKRYGLVTFYCTLHRPQCYGYKTEFCQVKSSVCEILYVSTARAYSDLLECDVLSLVWRVLQPLKTKVLCSSETSGYSKLATQRHIPEYLNPKRTQIDRNQSYSTSVPVRKKFEESTDIFTPCVQKLYLFFVTISSPSWKTDSKQGTVIQKYVQRELRHTGTSQCFVSTTEYQERQWSHVQ
jgi:hypothetical protein